ncbi:uncharacterized protein LY79DRAFT_707662 [Colletotrichum navitas]|uniref:Uncharacterized protein n=1 Tax=Colletotrichum navitas TaxID=681940 RepID=A0AAD8PLU8_9PEZI|nr:uncharacterized protein LY79DRAFT_707662 [Colletotrichum navitas]KAK1569991.1 hypothetical protein LY79DRAFT_707662 [Colletotrichum navitas]
MSISRLYNCLLTQKETLRVLDLNLEEGIYAIKPEEEAITEDYGLDEEGKDALDRVAEATVKKDKYFLLAKAEAAGPLLVHQIPDKRKYSYTIGSFYDFTALTHLSINIQDLNCCLNHLDEGPSPNVTDISPSLRREFWRTAYLIATDAAYTGDTASLCIWSLFLCARIPGLHLQANLLPVFDPALT